MSHCLARPGRWGLLLLVVGCGACAFSTQPHSYGSRAPSGAWDGSADRLHWPVAGRITSPFGRRAGHPHTGIDIGAPRGSDVRAAAAGSVLFAGRQGGYGNMVLVRHADGLVTLYAHHERNLVRTGQWVARGEALARVGATGHATGPHLHFEVRRGDVPTDPMRFLPHPGT